MGDVCMFWGKKLRQKLVKFQRGLWKYTTTLTCAAKGPRIKHFTVLLKVPFNATFTLLFFCLLL